MTKAFSGVRVLDFSQVLAGPSCTQHLALLGADVIKIEEPTAGDQSRGIMADNDIGRIGMSPYFLSMNANKRSITLDLKHNRAIEILARLAAGADVVVQNFRPGVLTRLGFGYQAVRAIKPNIIYCSISGYGQDGPFATAPAYDGAVQAVSGLMAVTGQPDGPPTRVGSSIVDLSTAMMAAFAIASALYRRIVTGEGHADGADGQRVDEYRPSAGAARERITGVCSNSGLVSGQRWRDPDRGPDGAAMAGHLHRHQSP
jgi:crotonobetainyl-CoA:carnitine CoA-transferase CaiB-like acyl-CoA transferase